jgi:hypothetical protein
MSVLALCAHQQVYRNIWRDYRASSNSKSARREVCKDSSLCTDLTVRFHQRPTALRIFALDLHDLCNFLVEDSRGPYLVTSEAYQRNCWSASVVSAKPGTMSVTARLSSSPTMQMTVKASKSGSVTIETTPSQTPGLCSIRRSKPRRRSAVQFANMNCSLLPPCLPARRRQFLPLHWQATVHFGDILERSCAMSVAEVTAKSAELQAPATHCRTYRAI